jgi:hypothetical protein
MLGVTPPRPSGRRRGHLARTLRSTASAELLVVDAVPQHDEEPDQQPPSDGNLGFRMPSPTQQRNVDLFQVVVIAGGNGGGLDEYEAKEGAALLGDLSKMVLIREACSVGASPT